MWIKNSSFLTLHQSVNMILESDIEDINNVVDMDSISKPDYKNLVHLKKSNSNLIENW